jgi:hypothetical protein
MNNAGNVFLGMIEQANNAPSIFVALSLSRKIVLR